MIRHARPAPALAVPLLAVAMIEPSFETLLVAPIGRAMLAQPQVLIPVGLVVLGGVVGSFILLVATFGINARAAALALEEGRITAA